MSERDEQYWEENYRDLESRILAKKPFRFKPESEENSTYIVTPIITPTDD